MRVESKKRLPLTMRFCRELWAPKPTENHSDILPRHACWKQPMPQDSPAPWSAPGGQADGWEGGSLCAQPPPVTSQLWNLGQGTDFSLPQFPLLKNGDVNLLSLFSPDSLRPHGLLSARILWPRNSPGKNPGVACHFLLQGIIPTQGSNSCLLHCRQILYHWATEEALGMLICLLGGPSYSFKSLEQNVAHSHVICLWNK